MYLYLLVGIIWCLFGLCIAVEVLTNPVRKNEITIKISDIPVMILLVCLGFFSFVAYTSMFHGDTVLHKKRR